MSLFIYRLSWHPFLKGMIYFFAHMSGYDRSLTLSKPAYFGIIKHSPRAFTSKILVKGSIIVSQLLYTYEFQFE